MVFKKTNRWMEIIGIKVNTSKLRFCRQRKNLMPAYGIGVSVTLISIFYTLLWLPCLSNKILSGIELNLHLPADIFKFSNNSRVARPCFLPGLKNIRGSFLRFLNNWGQSNINA